MEYEICGECGCEFSAEGTIRQGCTGGICFSCEQEQEQEQDTCAKCSQTIVESPTWQHDGLCYSCEQEQEIIMGRITDVAYDSTLNENVAFKYTDENGVEHVSLEWLERHDPHVGAPEPYYTLTERDKHLESNPLDVSEHELKVITEYLESFAATLIASS